jgi:hypothetical protein
MKRLFSLLLILCSFLWGDAQTVIQRAGAANSVNDPRHMASLNSFQPTYSDTSHANLFKGVDSVGAIIYTFDVKGFWYRQHDPKRWVRMTDLVAQTVQNITLVTDSSVYICSGSDNCDTVSFVTNLTDLTSTYLYTEDSLVVCNISTCDTVAIPKQLVYLFQNGLTSLDGIQEWGGTLLHNTEIYGGERKILFRAHPIYDYPFGVQMMQRSTDGGGLQYWHHVGSSNPEGQADLNNKVRLNLNYTGALYPTGSGNLPSYFGGKIGYFLGTNTTPEGSYGLKLDEPNAKIGGVFFHTWDNDSTDAITLYGQAAPGVSHVASVNTPATMLPTRILTARTNRDLTFWGYDSTTRDDGVLTKVLGTDASGNVKLGRVAAAALPESTTGVDTSGRTYYVANGLSARNDSTHKLGGTLDEATQINLNGKAFTLVQENGSYTKWNNYSNGFPQWEFYHLHSDGSWTDMYNYSTSVGTGVVASAKRAGAFGQAQWNVQSLPTYNYALLKTEWAAGTGFTSLGQQSYARDSSTNIALFRSFGSAKGATARLDSAGIHLRVGDATSQTKGLSVEQASGEVLLTSLKTGSAAPVQSGAVYLVTVDGDGRLSFVKTPPTYADNAAAIAAGRAEGEVYRTADGTLKIVYTP